MRGTGAEAAVAGLMVLKWGRTEGASSFGLYFGGNLQGDDRPGQSKAVLPSPHAVAFGPNAVLITNPAAFPEGARPWRPSQKGAISGVFRDSNAPSRYCRLKGQRCPRGAAD